MTLHVADKSESNPASNSRRRLQEPSALVRMPHEPFSASHSVTAIIFRYWSAIRRHAWRIMLFVIVTVLVTALILLRIPKEYEGTATIRVDPFVPIEVVGNQPGSSNSIDMGSQLSTNMHEIVTPSVVAPALVRLGLMRPGEYGAAEGSSTVLTKIIRAVKVTQVPNTYLLNISYRSASPEQAAAVANALADQFILHEYETRSGSLLSLSHYMRQQVQELGDRMKDSQRALESFERDNAVVDPDIMSSSLNQQLSSLQQELGQEEAQQRALQGNLALTKEGNLDALVVSDRGSALAPLLQARQQAVIDFASIASQYGPGNYLYKEQQRKLAEINDAIRTEQEHVAAQIQAQARAAAVQVGLTAKRLADVKAQLDGFSHKSVQFAILKQESDTDKTLYNDLLGRLNSAELSAGYHSTALRIINPAHPENAPVYPRVGLTLFFAFLISGFLGVVGSIASTNIDRTLCDPATVTDLLGVELVGFLPKVNDNSELLALLTNNGASSMGNRSQFVETLLGIRSTLMLRQSLVPLRSLAVVSSQPGEGKTTFAVNLAAAFAALGRKTLIVDGDLLRPRVHKIANVSNRIGLSSLLLEEAELVDALLPGPIERLTVLPAGPPSSKARELIAMAMEGLIEELEERFDIVIIDTPPLLGFADTLSISAASGEAVLVIRAGKTPREYAELALEHLRQAQAAVSGVVLNDVDPQLSPYYHWYGQKYYQQYSTNEGGS